ncbi:MAG: DUF2807 domain-containing protein [Bacteroidales bacterium]|nr:DUF2807 domain-containing protein [Bacteroidales bacterium]
MKKIFVLAALLATALSLSAQTKEIKKEYSAFSVMEVSNAFDVTLIPSEDYSAVLTVDEVLESYVQAFIKGKTLYITLDTKSIPKELKKQMNSKNTPAPVLKAVVRAPSVSSVILSDDTVFGIAEPIQVDKFSISASGNAKVKGLSIQAKSADVTLDKKAEANMKIAATTVNVNLSSSSKLTLEQEATNFNIQSSGSGELTSTGTSKAISATTSGSSVVTLNGSTSSLEVKGSGSSNVNAVTLTTSNASVVLSNSCTVTENASDAIKVEMSGKSTLIFNGNPKFDIVLVKTSTIQRYK